MAGRRFACKKCKATVTVAAGEVGKSKTQQKKAAGVQSTTRRTSTVPGQRTVGSQPANVKKTVERRTEELLAKFQGEIDPVRPPMAYQFSALLVSVVMVILPLIYVAVICLVAYFVYWHFLNNIGMLEFGRGRGKILAFIAYVAPGVVGGISVLFMFKPLFARPSKENRTRSLTDQGEPILFAFVEEICETVGAPLPKKIYIDNQINASAGFRAGLLSMLRGNDLVLTIGMPLIAGTTIQQFGGVLAHEFGHFSQGVGMRLTYVIRSISFWFARVVYQRDEWDDWLESSTDGMDFRIAWIFYLARAMVYLTRKLLWLLMMVGHAVAGFLLRQMEFDADRYEARFAGSENFAATARRLRELNVGSQAAHYVFEQNMRDGRLLDDLPLLTKIQTADLDSDLLTKVNEDALSEKTGWLDTHPCDRERIASAHREDSDGVFSDSRDASELFVHFEAACKNVTLDYYEEGFGRKIRTSELHSTEKQFEEMNAERESQGRLSQFLLGEFRPFRLLPVETVYFDGEPVGKEQIQQLSVNRKKLARAAAEYATQADAWTNAAQAVAHCETALLCHRAGTFDRNIPFKAAVSTVDEARASRRKAKDQMDRHHTKAESFESLISERIRLCVAVLNASNFLAKVPAAKKLAPRAKQLCECLAGIRRAGNSVVELRQRFIGFTLLLNQISANSRSEDFVGEVLREADAFHKLLGRIREQYRRIDYPFDHTSGAMTLSQYLMGDPCAPDDLAGLYHTGESLLDAFSRFHGRTQAELADICQLVESKLGMPSLNASGSDN